MLIQEIIQVERIQEEHIRQDNQHILAPLDQVVIHLQDTEAVDQPILIIEPIHQDHHHLLLNHTKVEGVLLHLQVNVLQINIV